MSDRIKKLFCWHIYKTITKEFMNQTTSEWVAGYNIQYKVFAYHETCIKCGKNRIIKGEEMV